MLHVAYPSPMKTNASETNREAWLMDSPACLACLDIAPGFILVSLSRLLCCADKCRRFTLSIYNVSKYCYRIRSTL